MPIASLSDANTKLFVLVASLSDANKSLSMLVASLWEGFNEDNILKGRQSSA